MPRLSLESIPIIMMSGLAACLLVCAPDASRAATRGAVVERLTATLDQLLTHEREEGGWMFRHRPGTRPRPNTMPLRIAEWLGTRLDLATWDTVVVRSPGTPAAGLALLGGHRLTGREQYLAAARRAGDLLIATQMPSGGWFSELPVEGKKLAPWFESTVRRTNLDDDVTSGAIRFLLALAQATTDERYERAARRGLALLHEAQLEEGAWPLVWRLAWKRWLWSTSEDRPALNDGATSQVIVTLMEGGQALRRADFRRAAERGGDWLARVRNPPPAAGWAQQYDPGGRPGAARRYEPAALGAWETRYAIEALLVLAAATGDERFCRPIAEAVTWLERSALRPGCWARLYSLGDNEPLYLDDDGARVDEPREAHQPYDWRGDFGIASLLARLGTPAAKEQDDTVRGLSPLQQQYRLTPPIAGDPGECPGRRSGPFKPDGVRDPRVLIAQAARLQALLEQPPAPSCTADGRLLTARER